MRLTLIPVILLAACSSVEVKQLYEGDARPLAGVAWIYGSAGLFREITGPDGTTHYSTFISGDRSHLEAYELPAAQGGTKYSVQMKHLFREIKPYNEAPLVVMEVNAVAGHVYTFYRLVGGSGEEHRRILEANGAVMAFSLSSDGTRALRVAVMLEDITDDSLGRQIVAKAQAERH